jgi:ATP-dependent helicase HepA
MQLDPAEYHSLLTLIDPDTAPTLAGFQAALARQEELSSTVRELLEEKGGKSALQKLSTRFPDDEQLGTITDEAALLAHLAETYSLSDRLIRNRRSVVGGFAQRRLHRHPVEMGEAEQAARTQAIELLRIQGKLRGAPLSSLLRRLESSPAAFLESVKGAKSLAELKDSLHLPEPDAKLAAFRTLLADLWRVEPDAKVLVFTEARETLEMLQARLRDQRIEALGYHGDLPLLERDRQVARFRDPDGPKVLVCTEVGGEGRNFQFSHHLVNYDLPWSPATMEQRIGRLDRIGQTRPVEIHVFDLKGTLSSDVLGLLADSVGVFGETVGGLDAVLEEVEPRLTELALAPTEERAKYARQLSARVAEARASVKRAYDPLLDLRSFDRQAVEELVHRAHLRFGLSDEDAEPAESSVEDGLWAIARDLDERLEETVTELARKVGIGVDTDEQVEAFQCAFHFGHELKVEALPGLPLGQDKTVLGTFWRDSALEQEEIEYFATGHSIVEALFGFLRDGPYGRNGMRFIEKRGPLKARGLELLFHLVPPEAKDTSPGARVPSRQLSRFLDRWLIHVAVGQAADGKPKADASLLSALEGDGRSLKGDEIHAAFPGLAEFVDPAVAVGTQAAVAEMGRMAGRAGEAILQKCEQVLERIQLSLAHQGLPESKIEAQLAAERSHYEQLLGALQKLTVVLDSACGFVINR